MCQKALKVKLKDKKGNKEKKKKRHHLLHFGWYLIVGGENRFRERKSNFSLDFPVFGPLVLVGARGEVDIRYKGYAWTTILWSFDNFGR